MPKTRRPLYSPAVLYALESAYVSISGTIRVEAEHGPDVLAPSFGSTASWSPTGSSPRRERTRGGARSGEPSSLPLAGRRTKIAPEQAEALRVALSFVLEG